MSEVDQLHDALERQNKLIAALKNEIATKDKRIKALEAQAEEDDTRLVCAGCGFFIEPDVRWGRDHHAYHAKCLPAEVQP